jgi:excinuclease ABC subunit A
MPVINDRRISQNDNIVIRGARVHNLKNIDVTIPHNALTVVSGVSGSGKSSLAFDTVYAEGQRRYVESLSAYARQFLERIEKPDVDHMEGLAPAIAIRQKNQTRNPRSTVATATEIFDYLRLLFARCGTVHCLACGNIVHRHTVDDAAAGVLALPTGTRLYALFPILRVEPILPPLTGDAPIKSFARKLSTPRVAKKSQKKLAAPVPTALTDAMKERLTDLRTRGYNRLYQVNPGQSGKIGKIVEFSTPESLLDLNFSKPVYVLGDRLTVSPDSRARIVDAAEAGFRESGEILFEIAPRPDEAVTGPPVRLRFSPAFECTVCHQPAREPEPILFSFNNPFGACPRCQGFGNTLDFDLNRIIPDKSKTIEEGAIEPWTRPKYRPFHSELRRAAREARVPMDVAWMQLTSEQQAFVLDGDPAVGFSGVRGFFAQLERKKYKLHVRVFLSKYRGYALCPECHGQRLRAEARAVLIGGKNICEVCALSVTDAAEFFRTLSLTPQQEHIAGKVLHEIRQRLSFLHQVGLDYLTLDRLSSTLSGGEAQRIQLATSLGSRLVGALYVLDEPSIGLHPRDTAKLIHILHELRDLGNTILVVEHDPEVIRSADRLLDLGPGAGELGGKLMASGTVAQIRRDPNSLTGRYLSGKLSIPVPRQRRQPGRDWLRLKCARGNNLRGKNSQGLDLEIPLGMLVAVTGVSGSGKSTLVHDVLYRAVMNELDPGSAATPPPAFREITGVGLLNDAVMVDQSPIGRTPRSNPVTYIKAFDAIRDLYAAQPDARRRGYTAGTFSFNVPGGRCDVCEGDGVVTVEMQFLADVELPCEECGGTRYKSGVLEIKYKGRNIYDVLNMTVREALTHFAGYPKIINKLQVLDEIGLGYVRLGQSATTLSGGEAQRVKLAAHLASVRGEAASARTAALRHHADVINSRNPASHRMQSRVLYILDEPTTGLHFDDVSKLLASFRKLIDSGGSVLLIEHNLDIIKSADWVIDLGPEGGVGGGMIVAAGTPEEIAAAPGSHTGQWLRTVLPKN